MEREPVSTPARWAVLTGAALTLTVVSCIFAPYLAWLMHTSNPFERGMFSLVPVMLFFMACSVNLLLVRKGYKPFLNSSETVVFYFILIMGAWAGTWAFLEGQMPLLTSPYVLATPQNGWLEHVLPYLRSWMMGPGDEPYASAFWDGLPTGIPVPWTKWLVPVAMWTLFSMALAVFSMSIAGLLGRHWSEHDRLAFPHAEILLGMARNFLHSRSFWWGVAVASVIPAWNLMQKFLPMFPTFSLFVGGSDSNGVEWLRGAEKVVLVVDFMVLGILYFIHRHIIISIVIFYFLVAIEKYALSLAGIALRNNDLYSMGGNVGNWQSTGALIAYVLIGFWSARQWLLGYARDAWRGTGKERSWLSPRANLVLFAASFAFIALWLFAGGLSGRGLGAFMVTKVFALVGMARITAETGLEAWMPVRPQDMAIMLGTHFIAPAGFVAMVVAYGWTGDMQVNLASRGVQVERLRGSLNFPRAFFWILVATVGISTAVTMYSTVHLAYTQAANNFGTWAFQLHARHYYDQMIEGLRYDTGVDWERVGWLGAGAVIVGILAFLRNYFVGWFLHPIGFVIGGGARIAREIVFIALVAWIVKSIILKVGGIAAYEKYKPFFAGLVVGFFLPWFVSMFLDPVFFPRRGIALPIID